VLLFSSMSADISKSAREVKYLLNNQNQIEIPFIAKENFETLATRPTGITAKVSATRCGEKGRGTATEIQ
jgi:hypothetical protein